MTFSDISSFDKTEDYLPILTAIIIVDVIGIILSYANIISKIQEHNKYHQYNNVLEIKYISLQI
jgi:hypothetical protein